MTPGQILGAILLAMVVSAVGTWQVQEWRMGKKLAQQAAQHGDDLAAISNAATAQARAEQAGLHKDDLAAISNAASAQARAEQDKRLALEQKLSGQDQQHTKELSDAQLNQARLRDQLATADVRLSVLIAEDPASSCNVPTAPGAVGVVHAARRAQLDPAHAQRIIRITDDGN